MADGHQQTERLECEADTGQRGYTPEEAQGIVPLQKSQQSDIDKQRECKNRFGGAVFCFSLQPVHRQCARPQVVAILNSKKAMYRRSKVR